MSSRSTPSRRRGEDDHERLSPKVSSGVLPAGLILVVIILLSTLTVTNSERAATGARQAIGPGLIETDPQGTGELDETGPTGQGSEGGGARRVVVAGEEGTQAQEGTAGQTTQTGGEDQRSYTCPQNAGATDNGVAGGEIRLAATVVRTGIATDFLRDAQFGVEAVRQKVNRGGGICGRLLQVSYADDGWDPATGQRIIERWIREGNHLGLAVNPSSEGLRGAINSGLLRQHSFPAVGADGMLIGQYRDPWVWPVATSTHSVMHIMARNAYDRGARTFGIVWEDNYRFGVEGRHAFVELVKRLPGARVVADQPIPGGELSYRNQASSFVGKCSGSDQDFAECDFVAVLLEPATASQWVRDNGLGRGEPDKRPKVGAGAPQPLFVDSFIRNCGAPCTDMWVWTSFKPPLPPFDTDPAVRRYVDDLSAVSSAADAANPHVQGAYVGMSLLAAALERLGPSPTREGLHQVLDGFTFDSGLAPPLTFRRDNRFAAVSAHAFQAIFNGNTFTGWRYTNTGFLRDADVHRDQLDDS